MAKEEGIHPHQADPRAAGHGPEGHGEGGLSAGADGGRVGRADRAFQHANPGGPRVGLVGAGSTGLTTRAVARHQGRDAK